MIKPGPDHLAAMLARLWFHLGRRRQRQFWLLLCLMLLSALAEVISLGAVLPFLAVLTSPEKLFSIPAVSRLAGSFGISSAQELVLPLTVVFAAAALLAGAVRILLLWANTRFAFATGADLSIEVYRRTLYQPYCVHIGRNSSEVVSGITSKVHGVVFGELLPLLVLISGTILLMAITVTLFMIDSFVATVAILGFGGSYGLISFLSRRQLRENSKRIAAEQTQVVKALQEGLGGIRDILIDGVQQAYCDIYRHADGPLQRAQGSTTFTSQYPRYAMEAFGMILIAILAYVLGRQVGGIASALPVLGAMALGAQRLMPSLQQTYSAWVSILGSQAALADTIALLDQPMPPEALVPSPEPMPLCSEIRFENLSFRYADDGPWVLEGINMTISKGCRLGIVGGTGSGKSTLLDLLMGLLAGNEGVIRIDGKVLSGGLVRAWQQTIAHVPQTIFLADTTLAENIAFGVPGAMIDMDRVKKAARQAQLAEFIESRADGYQARVGERGIRLSGGQRQRIGIARALYKQVSVLVFDEATSALDNVTEKALMESIGGLDRDLTVLMIAHRLSTVRHCDNIIEMQNGRIVAQGTYDGLLEKSPGFRRMAQVSEEKNAAALPGAETGLKSADQR